MPRFFRPPRCARIQSTKCSTPTTSMASSIYGSQSVSKLEPNKSCRPSLKITNRASRRPVRCTSFGSDLSSIPPNRRAAARSSFSCPGLTVKYADSSVTTPWLLPLPDFVVTWPVVPPVIVPFCFLVVLVTSLSPFL